MHGKKSTLAQLQKQQISHLISIPVVKTSCTVLKVSSWHRIPGRVPGTEYLAESTWHRFPGRGNGTEYLAQILWQSTWHRVTGKDSLAEYLAESTWHRVPTLWFSSIKFSWLHWLLEVASLSDLCTVKKKWTSWMSPFSFVWLVSLFLVNSALSGQEWFVWLVALFLVTSTLSG